jgi:hypothetical protein
MFPNANHVLMTPSSRFAPGFLNLMAEWMRERTVPGGGAPAVGSP